MKVVFMGTPGFAACCLQTLLDAGFTVAAVVTAPDKPAGRGMQLKMSEVKTLALQHGLRVLQPIKLRDAEFLESLREVGADVFVVVAFRMLPEVVWAIPPLGTINAHGSLLPQYRGAAPIQHAIINGERITGVTTFLIGSEIDTGDILMRQEMPIGEEETAGQLHDRMQYVAGDLLVKTLQALSSGRLSPEKQLTIENEVELKTAPKLVRENTAIHWNRQAAQIHDFCRGLDPFPGAWSTLVMGEEKVQVKVFKTASRVCEFANGVVGKIRITPAGGLETGCAEGWLPILEWQTAGKKRMNTGDWLRGFHGKTEHLRWD